MMFTYSAADNRPPLSEEAASTARIKALARAKQAARGNGPSAWDQAGAILDAAATNAIAENALVARPRSRRSRKQVTVDVIVVEPNGHGIGWAGYSCEIGFAHTQHRSHLTLVQFARQHFGTGILRKVGAGRYAVIRTADDAPSVWGEVFDRPKAA